MEEVKQLCGLCGKSLFVEDALTICLNTECPSDRETKTMLEQSAKISSLTTENQEQARKIAAAVEALEKILSRYVDLVNSGDAGFWNPESEPDVKLARETLSLLRDGVKGEE